MCAKVTRIHPNQGQVKTRTTGLDDLINRKQFKNPYSSRAEYNKRMLRFNHVLRNLLDRYQLDSSQLFDNKGKIDGRAFPHYYIDYSDLLDKNIADLVFGPEIMSRADREQEIRPINQKIWKSPTQNNLYVPGMLFFQSQRTECENQMLKMDHLTLMRDHLSNDEIESSAAKAFEHYDIYEFSNTAFFMNPFSGYLRGLAEVIVRLKPELLPSMFRDCRVIGFEQDYLEVERPSDIEKSEYGPTRCFLENTCAEQHRDLVPKGSIVRCFDLHPNGENLHYYGKLIDHNPK